MKERISRAALTGRLILSVMVLAGIIACENPSSVGSTIVPGTDIRFDTLLVNSITPQTSEIYSGQLASIQMGYFEDPVYGNFESTFYVRPSLINLSDDDSLDVNSRVQLQITFDSTDVYGDPESQTNFTIYEVTESWRSSSLKATDVIAYDSATPLTTFSVTSEDSVIVELPSSWVQAYAAYANSDDENIDSVYVREFHGLAIVPEQVSSKIIHAIPSGSFFTHIDTVASDTSNFTYRDVGFTLDTSNAAATPNRIKFTSFLDNYASVDLNGLVDGYSNENVIKAELVVYEDNEFLENNGTPGAERINPVSMNLSGELNIDLVYGLQFGGSTSGVIRDFSVQDTLSDAQRFNVSRFINELIYGDKDVNTKYIYLTPGGVLSTKLIHDHTSSADKRPKLILTIAE
ncbi:DUF4270 family protein [Balneola vulgaris]|uniref:DUF4270 family protein n=1 Tax=Balneola vulgaris TaxID=287535 RepID=UPI00039AC72D|nr:DUF4270 family protein [Balneola vulgaris]